MVEIVVWLLIIELVGLCAFPLAYRIFKGLPDRGWTFSKPIGLLVLAYGTWVIGLSHTLINSRWTVLITLIAMVFLSFLAARTTRAEIIGFVRREIRTLLVPEVLFVVVFVGWALIRGLLPAIEHTEQPMNFMFLNSVVASPYYPPNDPWLAGEFVSYYYFGYLMVGALVLLSGLPTAVGFNLALALFAALAAVAAFGLVYNLVRLNRGSPIAATLAGFGSAFLLIGASNLVGALEMVNVAGIGSQRLWDWIGVQGLTASVTPATQWIPSDSWWWWHASRVSPGTITEFPAFSLVLGDLHAHVMAVPFLVLLTALSLQLYLTPRLLEFRSAREHWPVYLMVAISLGALPAINMSDLPLGLGLVVGAVLLNAGRQIENPFHELQKCWRVAVWIIVAIIIFMAGAIATFQGSDAKIQILGKGIVEVRYLLAAEAILLTVACLAVLTSIPLRAITLAVVITGVALLLFTPFLITFETNASGVLPLRGLMTRPAHLGLIWGVSGFLALFFLITVGRTLLRPTGPWGSRFLISAAIGFAPIVLWLQPVWGPLLYGLMLLGFITHRLGFRWTGIDEAPLSIGSGFSRIAAVTLLVGLLIYDGIAFGERGIGGEFSAISRLLTVMPMALVITIAVYGAWSLTKNRQTPNGLYTSDDASGLPFDAALVVVLGMLALASALIMGAELFHLVDFFGGDLRRMNTVFKLYYQAWLLMALIGGFSLYYVSSCWDLKHTMGRIGMVTWSTILVVALGAVLYYPLAAPYTRIINASGGFDLDGQATLAKTAPAEYDAIQWIRETIPRDAIIVEAAVTACGANPLGCSDWNPAVGRIAGSTGRPTILGWEQHELQWRWSGDSISGRRDDVREIYTTTDRVRARELLTKYRAQFVVVGRREELAYGTKGLPKFAELGEMVFSTTVAGTTTKIYRLIL